ncbi:MAG: hypothetical protein JWO06_3891 [Bacteroidota bacterium]|nr:hypothetical protein [Bacteroidota bacterium]
MKAATVNELKDEMKHLSASKLLELCTRLARFKKENKELLTYLLFEAHDEDGYIKSVKDDMDIQFSELAKGNNLYLLKKSIRKIVRSTNKFIRYTGSKTVEIQLLLHFCIQLKQSGIPIHKSTALTKLYEQQRKKIKTALPSLHEDLQHDYLKELESLQL